MKNKVKKIIILKTFLILFISFLIYTACFFFIKTTPAILDEITPTSISSNFIFDEANKPTNACHASTITYFKGNLYSAWFGGTEEGNPDVSIYLSQYNGSIWDTPIDMSNIDDIAHYNPVLYSDDNKIYLYYKIGESPRHWITYLRESTDGINWTEEKQLVENDYLGRGPVKNKPIKLSNGTVICGASTEYSYRFPKVFIDSTTDMINYNKSFDVPCSIYLEILQPSLVELNNGKILMYLRTNRERIYVSESKNFGKSWSIAKSTNLLNNNSGIDVAKNSDGVLALVHNPVGEDWGDRTPLIVALSYDYGKSYTKKITLETNPGEYSYPSIISIDNTFYITYTYNRKQIKYVELVI